MGSDGGGGGGSQGVHTASRRMTAAMMTTEEERRKRLQVTYDEYDEKEGGRQGEEGGGTGTGLGMAESPPAWKTSRHGDGAAAGGSSSAIPGEKEKKKRTRTTVSGTKRMKMQRGLSSCLVWDWEDESRTRGIEEKGDKEGRGFKAQSKRLDTPEELREFLVSRTSSEIHDDETTPATPVTPAAAAAGREGRGEKRTWGVLSTNTAADSPSLGAAGGGGLGASEVKERDRGWEENPRPPFPKGRKRRPLIILHGLPSTFVRILLDSEALRIDPEFIEAHAWRRGYRPSTSRFHRRPAKLRGKMRAGGVVDNGEEVGMQFACWNYPELVRGFQKTTVLRKGAGAGVSDEGERGGGEAQEKEGNKKGRGRRVIATTNDPSAPVDLNSEPIIRAVSDREDLAAVFCRASLWRNGPVGVLFLDRPVWEEEGRRRRHDSRTTKGEEEEEEEEEGYGSFLKRARRNGYGAVTEPYTLRKGNTKDKGNWWDVSLAPTKEISSFEEDVHETLSTWGNDEDDEQEEEDGDVPLLDALEETAYQKWLTFFEVLTPRQHPLVLDGTSLEWRVMQALEGNLVMAREQQRQRRRGRTAVAADDSSRILPSDWEGLIQRLRLRIEILPTVPIRPSVASHYNNNNTYRILPFDEQNLIGRIPPLILPPRNRDRDGNLLLPPGPNDPPQDNDNQRALDRVTYLGGLLLPISIVSGVLSMNEDFEPGAPLFWVFWVAALPLTALTMVVIYADQLRRAEVWVQVGAGDDQHLDGVVTTTTTTNAAAAAAAAAGVGEGGIIWDRMDSEEKRKYRIGAGKTKKPGRKQTRYDGGHGGVTYTTPSTLTGLERLHPLSGNNNHDITQSEPASFPEAVTYGGLVQGDDIVIDLSGAIPQQGQETETKPQTISVEPLPPSPPPLPPSASPPASSSSAQQSHYEESSDEEDDDEYEQEEEEGQQQPPPPPPPVAWRRKELGWAGAAKCILKMERPKMRVEDGVPIGRRNR